MARKSTNLKVAKNGNEVGQSEKMREAKVVRSRNFYPTHYLNEVFADDIAGISANGDALLRLRQDALKTLATIADGRSSGADAEEDLSSLARNIIAALGFFEQSSPISENKIEIEVDRPGRASSVYSLNLEKRVLLKDDSEIWLATEASLAAHTLQCEGILESMCSCATRETDECDELKWRECVDHVFDSDHFNVSWLLLSTGTAICLFERNRWVEEHEAWLEADLRELWELNSSEHAKMVDVLFSSKAFAISSPESWHNLIATNAHKKATEVSRALRDTVRQSVELLANEVLAQHAKQPLAFWKDRDLKKAEHREVCSRELFEQVLRVVYRMLFILVVEGQPQSKRALPIAAQAYQQGLSLEKLRDLENVTLVGDAWSQSAFIWNTLQHQSKVYFAGFNPERQTYTSTDDRTDSLGFSFPQLGIHLFDPASTPLLEGLHISDRTMQQVLRKLSLAQTGTGKAKRTYRVYYGSLSLNRLGEVYEGLLSLRPQILDEKMYVLVRDPKEHAPKLMPVSKADDQKSEIFELDDSGNKMARQKGEFALTPTGFERKLSASYYTPEELTNFLAKESVDCLLKDEKRALTADEVYAKISEIHGLKICEPAMGNGAFCNAVVNEISTRLAKLYVQRAEFAALEPTKYKLVEAEKSKSFEDQRGRAKEHILRNGVYGVDLNPTAVELARVSLWLNALHKGGDLPYLDLKLRCGNSLVGAWINRYRVKAGNTPHFLFPIPEMLDSHLDGKFLGDNKRPFLEGADKSFVQGRRAELAEFSKMRDGNSDSKLKARFESLTKKIDSLLAAHTDMRTKFQEEVSREFALSPARREQRAAKFFKDDTAYNQLRGMMDLWCALWFWPQSEIQQFPAADDILRAMEFYAETSCAYGGADLEKQIAASGLKFLSTARTVALRERFFHWELEFPEVFANGGFDLVLGNPPWAPVRWEEEDFFEEQSQGSVLWSSNAKEKRGQFNRILANRLGLDKTYVTACCARTCYVNFLNESGTYEHKDSSLTNTYMYFFQRFLQITKTNGVHGIIAQDGLISGVGSATIQATFLKEVISLFRFHNEKLLFEGVGNCAQFIVAVSKRGKHEIRFTMLDDLFHPETILHSRRESTFAPYRGMKDENGKFELRGHPNRIVNISQETLAMLAKLDTSETEKAILPRVHGIPELEIFKKLASVVDRLEFDVSVTSSSMFGESADQDNELIERRPCHSLGVARTVLTGPNIFVANPFFQNVRPSASSHRDFEPIDLNEVSDMDFPSSAFCLTPKGEKSEKYLRKTPWGTIEIEGFRLMGRRRTNVTGSRSFITAIIPPRVSHVDSQFSMSFKNVAELVLFAGHSASLVLDFLVRNICGGDVTPRILRMIPAISGSSATKTVLDSFLLSRALRLNCVSSHYSDLWKRVWKPEILSATLQSEYAPKTDYSKLSAKWQRNSALRDAHEREQALCEIDAIVAILFGISKQDLLDLYRSQFGVLQKNLQDLPNQKVDPEKFHFPRYKAMSEAYDACLEILNKPQPKKLA